VSPEEEKLFREVNRGQTAEAAGARLGMPAARVNRLCLKWAKKKLYTYRTSPEVGWLTDAGRAKFVTPVRTQASAWGTA
jgi:hypothetical protein